MTQFDHGINSMAFVTTEINPWVKRLKGNRHLIGGAVLRFNPYFLIVGTVFVKSNFTLPEDMVFGSPQIISITTYSVLFIIGVTLNTISLYKLLEERLSRTRRTRMSLLLIHLSIADLMVSMLMKGLHSLIKVY